MDFFKNMDNITKRKIILTIIIAIIIVCIIAIVIKTGNDNGLGNNLYFLAFLAPLLSILFVNYYPNREIYGYGERSGGSLWKLIFGEEKISPELERYNRLSGTMPRGTTSEENVRLYKADQDYKKKFNALTKDQKENYDGMYG